ncbi:MAG: hypothetical protein Q8O38_16585 [Sulfurimicrobium sp.]|nr:hypothetical protein [Sulfurimicrobium sp.]
MSTKQNEIRPMFKPNGNGYDITPPGVLLLLADAVHGDPSESTAEGKEKAGWVIDAILSAAYRGGFFQGDVLHTLLARNQPDRRMFAMAQAACDAAGPAAIASIFSRMKLS